MVLKIVKELINYSINEYVLFKKSSMNTFFVKNEGETDSTPYIHYDIILKHN